MLKKLLLHEPLLSLTIDRLCQELIEYHDSFSHSVIIGMQPRGKFFADRVQKKLRDLSGFSLPIGYLDTTFYRDDFRRRAEPMRADITQMPFDIENKNVILIDDVLFTGRTLRAAMTALSEFGRPKHVELLVLIDRKYNRELPIQPDYVGNSVNTIQSQKVVVEWKEQGFQADSIWLVSND
ncbi:MAG: bifunctional pyr operon transcriptional regulator/uracil phosphoribosyltransferase PyrR [Bacteroidetes bacterium]|nr:MAG: bifunctional pyr operon transcriptional regulator/uracil phosphoribosyltransferase PyrR [Bacteroidota bacterium]